MNNKFCIVTWVYGRKYQGWIPLYIYSIKKNYPDYDIKIFVDNCLSVEIRRLLEKYDLIDSAIIYENVLSDLDYVVKDDMEKRCLRWLLNGYGLEDYQYVYWGDIDIYIVQEKVSLLQQHINAIDDSKMNYNNAQRLTIEDYISSRRKTNKKHLFRLTGLHFVNTKEYYRKNYKTQIRILNYLGQKKRIRWIDKIFFRDDERCLWLINFLSGNGFPMGSYELSKKVFRPLHGLHFALGRAHEEYAKIFKSNPTHQDEHKMYYDMFCKEYNDDSKLRELILDLPAYIVEIINSTCCVWKGHLLKDEIKTG